MELTKGDYVTGTIELKSGVMFQVDKDARLLGSLHLADYPGKIARHPTVMDSHYKLTQSLSFAQGCERAASGGRGPSTVAARRRISPGGMAAVPCPADRS